MHRFYKIVANGSVGKIYNFIWIFTIPLNAACAINYLRRIISCAGYTFYIRHIQSLVFKQRILSSEITFQWHVDQILPVVTKVERLDIIDLLTYYDGTND